jgi:hypothetical protein
MDIMTKPRLIHYYTINTPPPQMQGTCNSVAFEEDYMKH